MIGSRHTRPLLAIVAAGLAHFGGASPGFSQVSRQTAAAPSDAWRYADLADLYGAAPLVLRARIAAATPIKGAAVPAGSARFYVEADITTLIRGAGGVPPRIAYLVDVAPDSRGKLPKLKQADVLIAALPVPGRPGEIQLAARDAQRLWSAPLEARVRAIIAAVIAPGAAPAVTGIANAFHVAGSIPGEGETQVFLTTAGGAPVSLTILRRPGEAPRWAVALGEIVDEAAGPPAPDTLAWYRLACFLPPALPDAAVGDLAPADADAARADYRFVIAQLGPCVRARA